MKLPEKAPDWQSILKNSADEIFGSSYAEISAIVNKIGNLKEYRYWDRFKYRYSSENLSSEKAWTLLKLNRLGQIKKIPALDKKNNSFGYWLPDSVLKELHQIDVHAAGEILVDDPHIQTIERDRYIINSLMEEAIASSMLEGAGTTREKAKEMLRSGRKPKDHAEKMIFNNFQTIKNIKEVINKPLSKELIFFFHESITRDTLNPPDPSYRFRKESEDIQIYDDDGSLLFIPPPAEEIEERIEALCNYANNDDINEFVHPVVKAIILHFWFAYIHPFADGNGRTARALFYWYVLKNKYWLFEYLSISRVILKAPVQYKRAYLYVETDDGDLTYFLYFHLRAIRLSIQEIRVYLEKEQIKKKQATDLLMRCPGLNMRQCDLLHHALSHTNTVYTIKTYQTMNRIVHQTARTDLRNLVEIGLLEESKRGRTYYFSPAKELSEKIKHIAVHHQ